MLFFFYWVTPLLFLRCGQIRAPSIFGITRKEKERERERDSLSLASRPTWTDGQLLDGQPASSLSARPYVIVLPSFSTGFPFFLSTRAFTGTGYYCILPPLLLSYYWIPLADRAGAVGFILFFVCVCVCVCYFTSRADAISAPGHRLDRGGARRFAVRFTAVAFSAWCAPLASID